MDDHIHLFIIKSCDIIIDVEIFHFNVESPLKILLIFQQQNWSYWSKLEKDYIGNAAWMHRDFFFLKNVDKSNAMVKLFVEFARCKTRVQ